MRVLMLEEPRRFALRDLPEPTCGPGEIILRVGAVGVCGTDFHIYSGEANYNSDAYGRIIPLEVQPQILGHEFCGTVIETGPEVEDLKTGDRVVLDQGLNCFSQRIRPVCEYCESGHSHQCRHYRERGITGLPGAMQELVAMPAVNAVAIPADLSFQEAVLAEPLGCIIHALDMVERAVSRYSLAGESGGRPVVNILILGSGPAGLLFLQYLRRVKQFPGRIFVADFVDEKLELARQFGGIVLDLKQYDLAAEVSRQTEGEKIHLLIEATGHGSAFEAMPSVLRKQGTVLLYGHGHRGTDLSVLNRIFFLEPSLVVSCGASGSLDPHTHRPQIHRRAVDLIASGRVQTRPIVTHRYHDLEEVEQAFREDCRKKDYVKGLLSVE